MNHSTTDSDEEGQRKESLDKPAPTWYNYIIRLRKEVNRMNREYWDLQPEEVYQDSAEALEIQRELGSAHASTQFSWDSD